MSGALVDSLGFVALARASGGAEAGTVQRSLHESATLKQSDAQLEKAWQASKNLGLHALAAPQADQLPPQLSKTAQQQLKALVRRGVPFSLRPAMWLVASGGLARRAQAPAGHYAALAASAASLPSLVVSQVDADVRTVCLTWRQHPMLKTPAGIEALSRVLLALLNHSPDMGYSRQLCHMAAFALVVFGGPPQQEQVFWTLAALLQDKLYGYCNGQWLVGSRVEQEVLTRLAGRKLPRLTAHLATARLPLAAVTQPWLQSLFVCVLPPETLARVWDCMMVEGGKLLLRVGLALLKMYEQTLSSCTFPEVLKKVVELRVSRTTDAAALLAAALKGCGSLPGEQVAGLRAEVIRAQGLALGPTPPAAIPGAANTTRGAAAAAAGGTVGSAPASGTLASAAQAVGGGLVSSLLHRSASGPKLLARMSPTAVAPAAGSSGGGSPLSSPGRSSDSAGTAGRNHGHGTAAVLVADTVVESTDGESDADISRGSSPGRSSVTAAAAVDGTGKGGSGKDGSGKRALSGPGKDGSGKRALSGRPSLPAKRASVGAHLSSMIARLGWGGTGHAAAATAAAAAEGPAAGVAAGLPRSATTTCVRSLAAY